LDKNLEVALLDCIVNVFLTLLETATFPKAAVYLFMLISFTVKCTLFTDLLHVVLTKCSQKIINLKYQKRPGIGGSCL
jgi:hypothetical protein